MHEATDIIGIINLALFGKSPATSVAPISVMKPLIAALLNVVSGYSNVFSFNLKSYTNPIMNPEVRTVFLEFRKLNIFCCLVVD